MGYMSEKEFNSRLRKIQSKNKVKERKEQLKAEKEKYKHKSNIETHKFLAVYLFVLFNVILIYALVAMWVFKDLSYLGVLITDIVAQILVYAIYCLKAYSGKKQEELIKFEKEKLISINGYVDDADDFDGADSDDAVG